MKSKLSILIIIMICISFLFSCKKYPDDPEGSIFIPVKIRITGEWHRYYYYYYENYYDYYEITEVLNIKKYNIGSHYFIEYSDGVTRTSSSAIEWKFSNSKDSLYFRFDETSLRQDWQDWTAFYIEKLTNKELVISLNEGWNFEFTKK